MGVADSVPFVTLSVLLLAPHKQLSQSEDMVDAPKEADSLPAVTSA